MANSPTFVDHALDLLSALGPVQARRMFGGHGLYARGVMVGLLDDDELFLKTDAESRPRFVAAGCRMWVYPGDPGAETSYWRPPDDAHEDPEAMLPWARLALEAALRKQAAKEAEARAAAERRAAREAKAAERRAAAKRAGVRKDDLAPPSRRRATMAPCEGSPRSSSSPSPQGRASASRSGSGAGRRRGPTRRRS
jgi:DNA transformation protein